MGEGTVNEEDKKTETDVTPEGAVEVNEQDLDKASGGAGYIKSPTEEARYGSGWNLDPTVKPLGDGSVKPLDQSYDLKKL
jgi:hypothetical protein